MSTANLTAADLDAIEARWAAVGRRIPGGPDPAYEAIPDPRPDLSALLAAVREARGLVEALVDIYRAGRDPYGFCGLCKAALHDGQPHAPDCAWQAARDARDAWKGGGDE